MAARQVAIHSADLPELQRRAQVADERRAALESLRSGRDRLREQLQALDPAHIRRYAALELLNTMALYSPDDVVLKTFTMRSGQPLEIVGTAPTSAMVVGFQEALRDSPLVTQVELDHATRVLQAGPRRPGDAEGGAQWQFTLKARLWTDREPAASPRTLVARERSL
jgi:Tfp pilus assembly protein PilN